MERIIQDIASAYWWISVVIVGIVINIVSTYIKPALENILSHFSSRWENRRKIEIEKFNHNVALLKSDHSLRSIYALREIRYRIRSFVFMFLAFIVGGLALYSKGTFPPYASNGMGVAMLLILIISMDDFRAAMRVKNLIEYSTDHIRELP